MKKHLETKLIFDSLINYQIPQIHIIISSYVVDNEELMESFKKYKNGVDFILEHLYNSFNGSIEYTEKIVMDLILELILDGKQGGIING